MKKKDFEKPKKILFKKLTVKETEKVTGGDTLVPLVPSDSCPEKEDIGGGDFDTLPPARPGTDCV